MSIGKLWLYIRRKGEFWTFRLSGALCDTHCFMFNTMSVLDVFTSFLCPFRSHTEIAYSKWLLLFHRVKLETDLPVRLLEKFTYFNNEFFVHHIDTLVINQRKCIQNRRFSKHISYVAAWTSFNQDLLYQIINLWFKIRVYYIKSWTNDLKSRFIISNHKLMI